MNKKLERLVYPKEQTSFFKKNDQLKVILPCPNSLVKFEEILIKISSGEPITTSFYVIKYYVSNSNIHDIISSIVKIINSKVKSLETALFSVEDNINFGTYLQALESYEIFRNQLASFVKQYVPHLDGNKIYYKPIRILCEATFIEKILLNEKITFQKLLSMDENSINSKNIAQLLKVVPTSYMENALRCVDSKKIFNVTLFQKYFRNMNIVDVICRHIDELIRKEQSFMYYAACKICDQFMLYICYSKYMQTRILAPGCDLMLEKKLVKSVFVFQKHKRRLLMCIADVERSREMNNPVRAIFIDPKNWIIYNKITIDPVYPPAMKVLLDDSHSFDKGMISTWQPSMGMAVFEAQLGKRKFTIESTILQAIVLLYIDDNTGLSEQQLVLNTNINAKLMGKIIDSMKSVLVYDNGFIINESYYGDYKIDLRKEFLQVFQL